MPLQAGQAVENNFKNGLITEATGLNFPENACTDTDNCVFNWEGSVSRRPAFDFENDFSTKTINRTNSVVNSFLWKNVTGVGDVSLEVLQVGATLYFYKIDGTASTSNGAIASTITLSSVSGAPTPEIVECQFSNGNGKLFVTHPYLDPFYITYDDTGPTVTAHTITVKIRDLQGDTADALGIAERPTATRSTITKAHLYNLYNQGWNLTNLSTWDTNLTTMPSNADVMWSFKNSTDAFDTSTVPNVINGNSEAPKGHYIYPLAQSTRNTLVSADDGTTVTTVTETGTGSYRPATCAFFAGRIFFGGIKVVGFNANVYFSQIVQRDEQYGFCYQKNDPTSQENADLLPDDGGVIVINEAGNIIKLIPVIGGLLAFAERGVWLITGSTGIGFTATDYTIQKISSITTLSANSFVDIQGSPCWWTAEGIYVIDGSQQVPTVKSLTIDKIKTYYDTISVSAKQTARGSYNYVTSVVQWIFKANPTGDINEDYEFDTVLNLNTLTGAFYPWSITDSAVTINGITLLDGTAGLLTASNVEDDSTNLVIDDSGNQVITFSAVNTGIVPQISYIVSYADSGSFKFTFASARNTNYLDWFSYDETGTDYTSTFTTGFKIRGGAIKRWQSNWLRLYSDNLINTKFYIRGLWDYATSNGTHRWSSRQLIDNNKTDYANDSHRVKIRGHGLALQYMVESFTGQPFEIIGWSEFSTTNQLP